MLLRPVQGLCKKMTSTVPGTYHQGSMVVIGKPFQYKSRGCLWKELFRFTGSSMFEGSATHAA
eukprot:5636788-Amphidinium_carterae.1